MKTRLILMASMLSIGMMQMAAQNEVRGKVTDKNGNPIAGAKVEDPKTMQSVLTDPDGTFFMPVSEMPQKVKVRYVGMSDKTVRVEPDMNIQMKEASNWQLGVRAGAGMSSFIFGNDYSKSHYDYKARLAWKVSVDAEKEIMPNLFFMPSLEFSNTNVTEGYDGNYRRLEKSYHSYNIQVPLLLGYDIKLSDNISIRPKIGPYVGHAMGEEVFDDGWRTKAGLETGVNLYYKKFIIGIEHQLGLIYESSVSHLHSSAGYLTVGYRLSEIRGIVSDWRFAVRAGVGASSLVFGTDKDYYQFSSGFAWKIAVSAEKKLSEKLYFMPTLEYSRTKVNCIRNYYYSDDKYDNHIIRIPLMVGYNIALNDDMSIRPKLGPYLGCGYYYDAHVGMDAGIDFNYKKYILGFDYQLDFNYMPDELKNYCSDWYVSVGYRF